MKKKTYILLSISLSLLILLAGVLWYGFSSVVSLKDEEKLLRGELQDWIKKSRQTSTIQNTLSEARKVKDMMEEYYFIPTEENQIALIADLEKVIKDTNSKGEVNSFDVSSDYSKIVGTIVIFGEWNDVYHTLLALEMYPIKLSFDDVSITEEQSAISNSKGVKKMNYRAIVKFTIINIKKPN